MAKPKAVPPQCRASRLAAFAKASRSSKSAALPKEAIEDLREFRKLADKGNLVGHKRLVQWMREEHGVKIGRYRLATIASEHGIEPWWGSI